jgi:hypothetical protein
MADRQINPTDHLIYKFGPNSTGPPNVTIHLYLGDITSFAGDAIVDEGEVPRRRPDRHVWQSIEKSNTQGNHPWQCLTFCVTCSKRICV